jgi:3-hydroxybutyryl-CoA dehydrogenase
VRQAESSWTGLSIGRQRLVLTDGRSAQALAAALGTPDVAVFDRPLRSPAAGVAIAYAVAPSASVAWAEEAAHWLHAMALDPQRISDAPGLVVARTTAMLINEAADAVLQRVCTAEGADLAMTLGVNYPGGPFSWLEGWSVQGVMGVLRALDEEYRGERYRVSPWLRRRAGA